MCEQIWNWKNLPIVLTDHAYDKSYEIDLAMCDIIQLLEYSDDCLEDCVSLEFWRLEIRLPAEFHDFQRAVPCSSMLP